MLASKAPFVVKAIDSFSIAFFLWWIVYGMAGLVFVGWNAMLPVFTQFGFGSHSLTMILWSAYSLLFLRKTFGALFVFAFGFQYAMSEAIFNPVFLLTYRNSWPGIVFTGWWIFMAVILQYFFLYLLFFRPSIRFGYWTLIFLVYFAGWSLIGMPLSELPGSWGKHGLWYLFELAWNALFLLGVASKVRPRQR